MLDRPPQIGDVLTYRRADGMQRIGIFAEQIHHRVWCYFRDKDAREWPRRASHINDDEPTLELHSDADRLWADYCAAVLRGECEPLGD